MFNLTPIFPNNLPFNSSTLEAILNTHLPSLIKSINLCHFQ